MSRTSVLPFVLLALPLAWSGAQEPLRPAHGQLSSPGLAAPQRPVLGPDADPIAARQVGTGPGLERVLFDQPGDERIWAMGTTYKASFGADGFVYVPFFGSDAPRNYPVQFVLRSVRVAGRELQFDAGARATRSDARVTFDRGAVREIYELAARSVEQTFIVDTDAPGDVDVEISITTELAEDPARAGLQFANELGAVAYGTAWLVRGATKTEIPASLSGRTLRLHVPAAQRGAGPVVIDPVIKTDTLTATLMNSEIPDIAYDVTTDRWLVVWVHAFSASDHDVLAELCTGDGDPVLGSSKLIDPTTTSHTWPRVANLNSADRFLVTMERILPQNPVGQRYSVWGRTMDAMAPFALNALFPISPASNAEQNAADVGGDPGTGSRWTVVWVHGTDIHARQVEANGIPRATTIPIESTPALCINPQISLSNGNGLTPTPRWCVVYNLQVSATDWDVYGAVLDPSGVITKSHRPIATGSTNDLYPFLSSPLTDVGTTPAFLVSFERQGATPEMIVSLVDADLGTVVPETNLSRQFGFSGIYCRVESDGSRFAATCLLGTAGKYLAIATLAVAGNSLVLHEPLNGGLGAGVAPFIASKRSGGGGSTDYGVAFASSNTTPSLASIGIYQGRAPAGGFARRTTGCGLTLNPGGRPFLGQTVSFTLANPGTDLVGLLMGLPAPAAPLCANCSLGLDPLRPLYFFPTPMSLPLPHDPLFVGLRLAVQGFGIGSGPCVDPLRLSDTIDFTIQ